MIVTLKRQMKFIIVDDDVNSKQKWFYGAGVAYIRPDQYHPIELSIGWMVFKTKAIGFVRN
jgi:tellurite resistance-related uncharacterized protein